MNPIAKGLNEAIQADQPSVYQMLSELGKALYYPKGILSQSNEANQKATKFNATIGIATEGNEPMHFKHIHNSMPDYETKDLFPYAPPQGKPALRQVWKEKLLRDNPSLSNKKIGLPIVTNALTHGLSLAADLFVEKGDTVILPDKNWGNYNLIFGIRRQAELKTFRLFNEEGRFDAEAFRNTILSVKEKGKVVLLLNFPNNPTGYTPHPDEAKAIVSTIVEMAEAGLDIVAIIDDAYFGLFYEDSIKESLFGMLANAHPRILPIKVDGATKENYVWGFRVGFITYASESEEVLNALEAKTKGLIRGTISSGSHPSQTIILQSLQSDEFQIEKQEKFEIMKRRALKTKEIITQPKYKEVWTYYPFNSGYFMCLKLDGVDGEAVRVHLLNEYGVGTVSINSTDLRIAFSCVEEEDLEELFELIAKGIQDLK
ncbi:aminotransferase class I/II-fold pyridoxal phosphate-dependent enzyme [Pullulanibacillus sp. KACC 23026]|uniref:aminotransferase class I/II-fold pyridoxal phosphate-dependent enzyme n=1 Tax=Pullulanibacillus sp. KACC 23026 TaxID=3028315 RepID=UPI0023B1B357|nr:aminotransferase class I/II-fold pyridoxal phosphate-dependent enzyme [Pullulanibacillus sp. KACC 23026]WEG12144.1 aminotransferase class I/II-fold pyridoxal phosphate-dependent enzyme [Pullulanibacillus sp. KACC 23026]